ncbi:hypothetical protein A4G20_04765 [Pasteurellaceae bacterium RH1A]|nr:hypothetical protein A4G20_04765 [Pasteurellaceae bacterium RH1A]
MKMIPSTPYRTQSDAERKIFDQLRQSFSSQDYYALHSLNLTHHEYKRFGEIDFLIVCPLGLYVLEIKGGLVKCIDGIWEFTNRFGESNTKKEGPFKQAESALHGLLDKMAEKLPPHLMNSITRGYGVILPDCKLNSVGAEWDRALLCDDGRHRNLEGWLKALFSYSRQKEHGDKTLSSQQVKDIVHFLRPDFESIIPLHSYADQANDEIIRLTQQQFMFLDVIEACPRVVCEGGAGTGKTFLALELARRWATKDIKIGLVCHSVWLKNYLEEHHPLPNVVYSTLSGLKQNLKRRGWASLDKLIVDEGQDLLKLDLLDRLDTCLVKGLEQGDWCFFLDVNNQSGLFNELEQAALDYLLALNPAKVPLKRNCRNTATILSTIQQSLNLDVGTEGAGRGVDVKEVKGLNLASLSQTLEQELSRLIKDEGLTYSQITLLSDDATLEKLASLSLKHVCELDEYSVKSFPLPEAALVSVANFKGLENDVIIYVCPAQSVLEQKNLSYVAMSRAKSILIILYLDS